MQRFGVEIHQERDEVANLFFTVEKACKTTQEFSYRIVAVVQC